MAGRIRSIKPEILDDEEVSNLSDEAWRLWVSMWLLADDAGNCRAGDRYLAALVWQDSSRSPRVAEALRELRRARRVEVYENNGERFAHVRNWEKHQRIDNAGKPRVPGAEHENSIPWESTRGESPRVSAVRRSDLRPPTPTTDPEIPAAPGGQSLPGLNPDLGFDFEAVYAAYPRKEGRKKGLQRCKAQITTRSKYDALVKAVANYAASVAGKDPEYVKHFDTFMNCWEDFVQYRPPVRPAQQGDHTVPAAQSRNRPPDVSAMRLAEEAKRNA